jgi:hypothetical protein
MDSEVGGKELSLARQIADYFLDELHHVNRLFNLKYDK